MSKSSVLIAEDNPDIRTLLHLFLAREGFDVTTAEDGEQALRTLDETHPDLLLTDLMMPKVDGLELIQRVRAQNADMPIVAMSAYGQDDLLEATRLGANAAISKPLEVGALVETINRALARRPDLN